MAVVAAVSALSGAVAYLYETSDTKAVRDMTTEARGLDRTMRDLHSAYEDTAMDNLATAETARMFIDRLRKLESVGELDDQQKREYHNTLELLKTTMPDLADKIDTVNDSIEGGLPAVEAAVTDWQKLAEQQAKQEFAAELQQELAEALKEQMRNQQQLTAAQIKGDDAVRKQSEAYGRLLSALNMTEEQFKSYHGTVQDVPWRFMSEEVHQARSDYLEYGKQLQEAETDQRRYAAALEQTAPLIAQAENDIANYTRATEEANAEMDQAARLQQEVNDGMGQIGPVIDNATQSLQSLMETYQAAHDEALKSIQGQYALWNDVAGVSAVSAETINSKIEKQAEYWADYNKNLEALRERSGEIEGLSEVISSFADGSADSVNAIAGMASASDEDLATMVQNYQELQDAQAKTSEGIGALAAAFGQIYGAPKSGLFRNGYGGRPATGKGYASGTDYATPGLHLGGEEGPEIVAMRGGEQVIPTRKSVKILSGREAPNINAPPETVSQIRLAADELREAVINIILEEQQDEQRQSYS